MGNVSTKDVSRPATWNPRLGAGNQKQKQKLFGEKRCAEHSLSTGSCTHQEEILMELITGEGQSTQKEEKKKIE